MNMNFNIINNIQNEPVNKTLIALCQKGTELFLVGGYIRDLLLNRECFDKDYVVKGENACNFAKKVAETLNGYFIILDEDFDIARVVLPDKKNTLDFAGCLNQNIDDDIARRDYTINSIAYRIDNINSKLIDPFNGIEDIKNKKIRATSEKNLIEDPLRLLRAFRFASQLGFTIEEQTFSYIKKHKTLISQPAAERINVELFKFFEGKNTSYNLNLMKETELLDEIFPEMALQRKIPPNLHHHLPLIDHSIETVRQIELNFDKMPEWEKIRLNEEIYCNVKLISLLKFGSLLHDIGKPATWQIDELGRHRFINHGEVGAKIGTEVLKRLKLSKNAVKYIVALIQHHLYPSQLIRTGADNPQIYSEIYKNISEKALMRMFRKIGDAVPEVIFLAMADRLSAQGPEITEELTTNNIKGLFWILEKYKEYKDKSDSDPPFMSGNEIMEVLKIKQGPEIGKIIKALREAQLSGEINTKEEAEGFIKGFEYNKIKDSEKNISI